MTPVQRDAIIAMLQKEWQAKLKPINDHYRRMIEELYRGKA